MPEGFIGTCGEHSVLWQIEQFLLRIHAPRAAVYRIRFYRRSKIAARSRRCEIWLHLA